jgi:hypothetical protein
MLSHTRSRSKWRISTRYGREIRDLQNERRWPEYQRKCRIIYPRLCHSVFVRLGLEPGYAYVTLGGALEMPESS